MDFTFSRYSPGFYYFSVLTLIRPFFRNRRDRFSILARVLTFPGTLPDSTIFRYSHWFDPFPVLVRTIFRYSNGFYLFPVLARILLFSVLTLSRPFFGNSWDNFSIPSRILPFPGTLPDTTIFRDSHWFDPFPVLVRTIFRYSHGFYLFPVLARILLFFGTNIDSTIFL